MLTTPEDVISARSVLTVPGHRPERFEKAVNSGADTIMLDLEDSVGPELKDDARLNVSRWLDAGGPGIVRINGADSVWQKVDLAMLANHRCVVMLPKVVSARDIAAITPSLAAGSQVVPVFETALGILRADEICAMPGVVRAIFGNADLGAELGVDPADRPPFHYARSRLVLASAANNLAAPIDGVTIGLDDAEAVADDARHARALGFTAKACLHPRQVPVVNEVFSPTDSDLSWAREVVACSADGSVGRLRGQIVGKPVIERARRMLAARA